MATYRSAHRMKKVVQPLREVSNGFSRKWHLNPDYDLNRIALAVVSIPVHCGDYFAAGGDLWQATPVSCRLETKLASAMKTYDKGLGRHE